MGYNLLINGVYWGYNPLTNHLLTSWDIQVVLSLDRAGTQARQSMLHASLAPPPQVRQRGRRIFQTTGFRHPTGGWLGMGFLKHQQYEGSWCANPWTDVLFTAYP